MIAMTGMGDGNWAVNGERVRQDRLQDLMKDPALCNTYVWNSSGEAHRICRGGMVRREFSFPDAERYQFQRQCSKGVLSTMTLPSSSQPCFL